MSEVRRLIRCDIDKIKNDKACVQTIMDALRECNDDMTLCMMRIDDIQRALIQAIFDMDLIIGGDTI